MVNLPPLRKKCAGSANFSKFIQSETFADFKSHHYYRSRIYIRRYISMSDYMPLEKFSFFKKCEKSFTPEVATGNI